MFEYRFEKEKNLSSGGLKLFDQEFKQLLSPEFMKIILHYKLNEELLIAKNIIKNVELEKESSMEEKQMKLYKKVKQAVKNKKALRMLNNLLFVDSIKKNEGSKLPPKEYENLENAKYDAVEETTNRLVSEAFDYPDEDANKSEWNNP